VSDRELTELANNVRYLRAPRPPVDGGGGGGDHERMEQRISALEAANLETRDRLARIETRLETVATKADLHQEMHATTWKFISWTTGIGIALIGATMGIVKAMH